MRPFHDPAADTVAQYLSFGGDFFTARLNMGDISPCRDGIAHLLRVKDLVQGQVLRRVNRWLWTVHHNRVQCCSDHSHIVSVCFIHRHG